MDPYCGWNKASSKCTTAPDNDPSIHYWMQDIISCPIVEHPIDGMWSEWSSWETCQQTVPDPSAGDCLCRTRSCDNPKPAFGGKSCVGSAVEVTNCTGTHHIEKYFFTWIAYRSFYVLTVLRRKSCKAVHKVTSWYICKKTFCNFVEHGRKLSQMFPKINCCLIYKIE